MVNDTTRLLGLEGLAVVDVITARQDGNEYGQGPIVHLVTADETARACPECGTPAARVKEWVTTRPRDLPVAGRRCDLRWRKRRWYCDESPCPRGTFTEHVAQVPARARLTVRLRQAAGAAVADGGRTIVQSARDHGMSWPVACAAFTAHAARVLPDQPAPVTVLGIDEIRRGRPRWSWDETTDTWQTVVDRWHVGFVDISGGQGLLGQVEGRTSAAVTGWLGERGQAWRDGVAFVAIDMCTIFKSAVRAVLPQARLVVDHFHIVQLANAAVTEVRRRVTVQVRGWRGRKGNREWELRNRLTRSAARMHGAQLDPMVDDLAALPKRIGVPILAAWNAKEDLLDLLALARTHPDRTLIAERLFRFYDRCAASGLPELHRLASTVETWWLEILAFIQTGVTNAGSEGTNRVIKTVARDAYGFRNPENQRLRTRCATTRRSRGCLNPA
ncbi:ISL3 family transposase [Planomonospora sp. ID67723]|uniref:ISL3 family transposase n=1 Tax=Planomonospora sp. ID67723 TaxID=2738134 RepID=UPI0018C3A9B5|nr:ISL3 family transposase [Planomonospora sp. ID67723]MBG0831635.1 ISL3 family transposase [Planomonospora sp. ID67723]